MTEKINLDHKFALFDEQWRPKVIAAMNGQEIKLVKVKGKFPWHQISRKMNSSSSGRVGFASNFVTALSRWAPANALSSRAASSTEPALTTRQKFCCSNRQEPSTPAMSSTRSSPHRPVSRCKRAL